MCLHFKGGWTTELASHLHSKGLLMTREQKYYLCFSEGGRSRAPVCRVKWLSGHLQGAGRGELVQLLLSNNIGVCYRTHLCFQGKNVNIGIKNITYLKNLKTPR